MTILSFIFGVIHQIVVGESKYIASQSLVIFFDFFHTYDIIRFLDECDNTIKENSRILWNPFPFYFGEVPVGLTDETTER